jgi:beta-glucan synthesis-associated protein KRE6
VAPFNYQYQFNNASPATTIVDPSITVPNSYKGGVYQQSVSAVSYIDNSHYNNASYTTYGYELWSDQNNRNNGYITWYSQGQETWSITPPTVGPDPISQVSQRIIPEEPMVDAISYFNDLDAKLLHST